LGKALFGGVSMRKNVVWRVCGAMLGLTLATSFTAPAFAGPFADVGDRQLRQDVDLLFAAGLIEGPMDSWPLPWAQIDAGLNKAKDGRHLDPYLDAAVKRLDRLADFAAQRVAAEIRIDATNAPSVARDFGSLARAKGDASAKLELNTGIVSIAVGATVRAGFTAGTDTRHVTLEPSQVAIRLGDWAVYGGYTQEWFGPGHDGALLFSNNSAPFPKAGIKRLLPGTVNLPVLRWLGPIQFEIFGGVLDGPRKDYSNIIAFGTRLSFSPARGLQIGLNRAQQLCGDGRPCGLQQITRSFIGIGNADNPAAGNEAAFKQQAGNQLAGFDLSYVRRFGKVSAKLYFETEAEDSQHILIEQFARLVGMTMSGPFGQAGASWTATAEYADTYGAQLFNGTPLQSIFQSGKTYPGTIYNNSLYTDGFTYRGLPLGYWTAGDSRDLSLSAAVTDTRNRRWYASVRSVHLNIIDLGNPPRAIFPQPDGTPGPLITNPVSSSSEKFAIVTAGAELPTRFGDLRVEGRYQSDSPSTPGVRKPRAGIEVQLRERF
jgi:hypothetical protein